MDIVKGQGLREKKKTFSKDKDWENEVDSKDKGYEKEVEDKNYEKEVDVLKGQGL